MDNVQVTLSLDNPCTISYNGDLTIEQVVEVWDRFQETMEDLLATARKHNLITRDLKDCPICTIPTNK